MSKNNVARKRAKIRIRKKIFGTAEAPRLSVFRSLNQIYAQLIDDNAGITLVAASSLEKETAETLKSVKGKVEGSKAVGVALAKKALEKNITTAVFDRNGYRYHGRVKALADGVREGGLKI